MTVTLEMQAEIIHLNHQIRELQQLIQTEQ